MGLALAPDGRRVAMLGLGKLWIVPLKGRLTAGKPQVVAKVAFKATALAWSPDGTEVAWSAGVADPEDLLRRMWRRHNGVLVDRAAIVNLARRNH